jgi:cobalt-zinc-cadmium efflux system membrane fusion protein
MITHCIKKMSFIPLLALLLVACSSDTDNQTKTDAAAAPPQVTSDSNTPTEQATGALCIAHAAAASQCFICDAALRDPQRLWCREHARYEDRCWLCHPEIRDPNRLYCEEHGLYEGGGFLCHPELKLPESSTDPQETGISVASHGSDALFCGEHNVAELECGICQPALADNLQPGQGLKIRLPSVESEAKANIVAQYPQSGSAQSTVHAVGELRFNLNRLVRITPLTDGVVRRVHVDLGQEVKKGQVLAELRSPQIAESKAEMLKAVAEETVSSEALSRARGLHDQSVLSAQDLYDAQARHTTARASLRAAEQMLLDLGFDRQTLEAIVSEQEATSVLTLVAPFAGTVIERDAVVGDVVSMGDGMFSVADLSTLWLSLAVSEREVMNLRVGQRVEIRSDALDHDIAGEITWISSRLNETTRMAEVRAEVANPAATLRAGMFVDASIIVGESSASLLVPRDTVYRFGGNPFVFVRLAGDLYELRRVETKTASENLTAVTAGLTGHDLVAVEQSYLLKSEFQKSRLGAGCVD